MNNFIPSIDPLPQPPVFERVLFEQPWMAVGALLIIAILVAVVANRREQFRRGLVVCAAITAAAAALAVTATLVDTDHEQVARGTSDFMANAVSGGEAAVADLLAPDAILNLEGMSSFNLPRGAILNGVKSLDSEVGVRGWGILKKSAAIDGPNSGRSRTVIRVDVEGGGPNFSSWELVWRKDGEGRWRITRLICQSVNGRAPGQWFAGELARFARP